MPESKLVPLPLRSAGGEFGGVLRSSASGAECRGSCWNDWLALEGPEGVPIAKCQGVKAADAGTDPDFGSICRLGKSVLLEARKVLRRMNHVAVDPCKSDSSPDALRTEGSHYGGRAL